MPGVPASYLTSTKNVSSILGAIQRAAVPERISQEFIRQLGFPSSADRPIVPLLKSLGFADGSGQPTDRYRRFKDPGESARVLAEGMREAYTGLFGVNERADTLSASELKGIFARLTGKQEGVAEKMASTFRALAANADLGTRPALRKDSAQSEEEKPAAGADAGPSPSALHPLIAGLLRELPAPGSAFARERREAWLQIAATAFDLIYLEDSGSTLAPGSGDVGTDGSEWSDGAAEILAHR